MAEIVSLYLTNTRDQRNVYERCHDLTATIRDPVGFVSQFDEVRLRKRIFVKVFVNEFYSYFK